MRSLVRFCAVVLSLSVCAGITRGQGNPQFRPAVLASGADSLINRIDEKALVAAGQKDGAVMFSVLVAKNGQAKQSRIYRAMPGTAALEQELRKRLENAKFAPAIYNHQPVDVILSGTLIFTADAKPRLRLLLNQDSEEIKAANDFIAPQPVFGGDSAFTGLDYPSEIPLEINAVVDLLISVDAQGNPREMQVVGEEPPLLGFAQVAAQDFDGVKFIPAFRNGDPTECRTIYPISYQPPDWTTPSFAAPVSPDAVPPPDPFGQ